MNSKSEVFRVYNKAKKAANEGKLEAKRVNRALGLVQKPETMAERVSFYGTTVSGCGCPDFYWRNLHLPPEAPRRPCKHMIAVMMEVRINEAQEVQLATA